jgi:hypothetical protein
MPGLRLTKPQIERLCNADALTAASALRVLVSAGFLGLTPDGRYGRTDVLTGRQDLATVRPSTGTTPSPWHRILCLVELEHRRGPLKVPACSALRYASTLAVTHRARITALHVVPASPQPSLAAVAEMLTQTVSGEAVRELIDVRVAVGPANEALAHVATEVHADLIVLGRTGSAGASWSGCLKYSGRYPARCLSFIHQGGQPSHKGSRRYTVALDMT